MVKYVMNGDKSMGLLRVDVVRNIITSRIDIVGGVPSHKDYINLINTEDIVDFCDKFLNGKLLDTGKNNVPPYTLCLVLDANNLLSLREKICESLNEDISGSNTNMKSGLLTANYKDLIEMVNCIIHDGLFGENNERKTMYFSPNYAKGSLLFSIIGEKGQHRDIFCNGANEYVITDNIEVGGGVIKNQVSGITKASFGSINTIGYGKIEDFNIDVGCTRTDFTISANTIGKVNGDESGGIMNIIIQFIPNKKIDDIYYSVEDVEKFTNLIKMSSIFKEHTFEELVENITHLFKLSKITVRCSDKYIETQNIDIYSVMEELINFWTGCEEKKDFTPSTDVVTKTVKEISSDFNDTKYVLSIRNLL